MLKGETVPRDFYPFVENGPEGAHEPEGTELVVRHPARIAVYDDASAAPRVVMVEPQEVRAYLEEITATVNRLVREQGGTIPFMVIREIVENFIHAYFQAPTITILDGGDTIRFSDQGPGIREKSLALEYGTSSATEEMKRYIRGVGSGLPYVQQYMSDKGGSLEVEDNISGGTVVTISTRPREEARAISGAEHAPAEKDLPPQVQPPTPQMPAAPQQGWAQPSPWGAAAPWPQPAQTQMQPQPQQVPAYGYYPPSFSPAMAAPAPAPAPAPSAVPPVQLDERSSQALSYLGAHESCGPTELTRAFGASGPTWSRTLAGLAAQGLVMKDGQKYRLTGIGRAFV